MDYNVNIKTSFIAEKAFKDNQSIREIEIKDVSVISENSFEGCKALECVVLGDGIAEIKGHAFCNCTGLRNLEFGNDIVVIGNWAFYKCVSLEKVVIPPSVDVIRGYAFYDCSALKKVVLNEGIETISNCAFSDCSSLREIVIPHSVSYIGTAFTSCLCLRKVYYAGTKEEWDNIKGDKSICDATLYYYSKEKPQEIGNYWHYVDGNSKAWE